MRVITDAERRPAPSVNEGYLAPQTKGVRARWRGIVTLSLSMSMLFSLSACGSQPIEEVVTTAANRSSALPPGAEPLAIAPDLPERDSDIEAAGDRIAEAITYLKSGKRDRREAALGALNLAETSINSALRARPDDAGSRAALRVVLKDLDAAQRTVQRGSEIVAAKQLTTLNRNLDSLDLHPASVSTETGGESPAPAQ